MPGTPQLRPTDPDALARLRRFGGERLLNDMIGLYLETASRRIAAAQEGLAAGDASTAGNALHSLKSSSGQLGALRLSMLCEEGEAMARSGMLAGLEAVLRESREELERVERWLESERSEPSA